MKRIFVKSTGELLNSAVVDKYKMFAANGNPIRTATKVTLIDGRVFKFIDLLTKKEALKSVGDQLNKMSIDGRHQVLLEV